MLVAIKDIIDKSVDDGGLADSLVAQENDFVLENRGDGTLAEVEVADIGHGVWF